jgi:hypothetical protein
MFLARYPSSVLLIVLLSLAAAFEARSQELLREEEKKGNARFKYNLGLYKPDYGIYDEILERTEPGPESLREVLKLPSWLIVGGQQRTRYETLNGRWRAGEQGSDQQVALRTRLFFAVKDIFDPMRFTLELQDSRATLTDTGSFTTDAVNKTDIQQLHLDLVSTNFLGTGQPTILNIGRLNMDIGRRRWVARNSFRNTTQAFDGVHWQLGDERRWHVRAFLVEPVDILPERLDKAAPAQRNTLWGLYAESRRVPWLHAAFQYFGHRSTGPHRDFDMLGLRLFRPGEAGEFQYEIESSYQFGDISSAAKFAHFQHAEIGYTFEATWTPQLLVRFDYAANGFDPLYGARSFELIPTGIFGPFERSNIVSPGYRIMVTPTERMSLFVQHRAWWLADDEGPWVGTGLQDPTGRSGRFLGQTVELRARWGLIENIYMQAGYVHFAYGSYPRQVPGGPTQDHADYAYVQAELMF